MSAQRFASRGRFSSSQRSVVGMIVAGKIRQRGRRNIASQQMTVLTLRCPSRIWKAGNNPRSHSFAEWFLRCAENQACFRTRTFLEIAEFGPGCCLPNVIESVNECSPNEEPVRTFAKICRFSPSTTKHGFQNIIVGIDIPTIVKRWPDKAKGLIFRSRPFKLRKRGVTRLPLSPALGLVRGSPPSIVAITRLQGAIQRRLGAGPCRSRQH